MFGNGKVFISHTHEDNARCEPLLAALDAWQVDYWFDVAQLVGGEEFSETIQRAIRDRDILLRICTPAANRSTWMAREAELARKLSAETRGKRLIVNVFVASGYAPSEEDAREIGIDAAGQAETAWVRALREALGIPSRERRVNRRTVLGLGVTSAAALGAAGFAGKVVTTPATPTEPRFVPSVPAVEPAVSAGASHLRWIYKHVYGANRMQVCYGDGALFCLVGNDGIADVPGVFALNAPDGGFRWRKGISFGGYAPAAVAGTTLVAVGRDARATTTSLYAFGADGSVVWSTPVETDAQNISAIDNVSAITVSSNRVLLRLENGVAAFDATHGTLLWKQPPVLTSVSNFYSQFPAPVVAGNTVYAAGEDGTIQVLDLASGSELARYAVAKRRINATPTLANGTLYMGSEDGYCYAVDAQSGAVRWSHPLADRYADASRTAPGDLPDLAISGSTFITSTPTVANGSVVYIGGGKIGGETFEASGDYLHALDAATGKQIWRVNPSLAAHVDKRLADRRGIATTPLLLDGTLYVTAEVTTSAQNPTRDYLYAIDPATGTIRWSFDVPGGYGFPSSPVAGGGLIYFGSTDGTVYALQP